MLSSDTYAGKQSGTDESPLDQLTEHTDRLATSLRAFKAAFGTTVLVRSSNFESYSNYLLQLQRIKVLIALLHSDAFCAGMKELGPRDFF